MIEDKTPSVSGQPAYEQNIPVPQETASASIELKIQDRTAKSYNNKDIERYGINKPVREIIYAAIIKQERQETICTESEQTKATE